MLIIWSLFIQFSFLHNHGRLFDKPKSLLQVKTLYKQHKDSFIILLFCQFFHFRKYDVNNDGKLSEEELLPALQSLGFNPTKADVKRLMEAADSNGDGMIEYDSDEFIALLEELEDEPYDQVMEAFKYLASQRLGN